MLEKKGGQTGKDHRGGILILRMHKKGLDESALGRTTKNRRKKPGGKTRGMLKRGEKENSDFHMKTQHSNLEKV